jgi:ApaG protein
MYSETTRSVLISVETEYLPEHSQPDQGRYVWAYHITIENRGSDTVQLINRYWRIIDGAGQMQEVRGPGVVGEQPKLGPGERFKYTSGVPLAVPGGFMSGHYQMVGSSGEMFNAIVPSFSLDAPQNTGKFH